MCDFDDIVESLARQASRENGEKVSEPQAYIGSDIPPQKKDPFKARDEQKSNGAVIKAVKRLCS